MGIRVYDAGVNARVILRYYRGSRKLPAPPPRIINRAVTLGEALLIL